jgi:hypothetical protein
MTRYSPIISLCVLLPSCGAQAPAANAPADQQHEEHSHDAHELAAEDELDTQQQAAKPDPCAAGQCTPCGEAVCVAGFLCDEHAQACSWLPQCTNDQSCDCVQKALPDCSCEQRGNGLYVTCSE